MSNRFPRRRPSIPTPALALAMALALHTGCTQNQPDPDPDPQPEAQPPLEGAFVPIYRQVTSEVVARRAALMSGEGAGSDGSAPLTRDFYLAINKKELAQRWFLSAYLSQASPSGVVSGAARSLGTRVVSFKVQNGKLFVFDVADNHDWSDTFRTELVLEAYPIVEGFSPFERMRGSSDYLLFDPAAGLNRFRLLADAGLPLAVDLSFSQRFRKVPEGVTFDQVFTGIVTRTAASGGVTTAVPLRFSGTLGLGLRRYSEGAGYVATPLPPREHYFRSSPIQRTNFGTSIQTAAKWNLARDGKPITWVISGIADRLHQDPTLLGVDFVGAIKAGIESWNEAFGWKALEARVARPGESHGDDDLNFFIFDADRSYSAAFANWRTNPNTGEIRGASIYFPLARLSPAFAPIPMAPPPPIAGTATGEGDEPLLVLDRPAPQAVPQLTWSDAGDESLCDLLVPSLAEIMAAETPPGALPTTIKERVERMLGFIAAHEVGHTLGLRHNFKGSLKPLTSSLMEYVVHDTYLAIGPRVQSYDIAAIRYLYGLSPELPLDPFCTDEQTAIDPDCRQRDTGAVPLTDFFIPQWHRSVMPFLNATSNSISLVPIDDLGPHLRTGPIPSRMASYEALFGPIRGPLTPPAAAVPSFASRVDVVTQFLIRRMFLDPVAIPPSAAPAPPPGPPLLAAAIADLRAVLIGDGLRSAATRRISADVLKRFQNAAAYTALAEAREAIAAQLATATGAAAVETRDLLNRVDRYLAAYFD